MQRISDSLFLDLCSIASAEKDHPAGVVLRYHSGLVESYDGLTGQELWFALENRYEHRRRLLVRLDAWLQRRLPC